MNKHLLCLYSREHKKHFNFLSKQIMKKTFILLIYFMVTEFCVSQTISLKGLVKEMGTKEAIPSANIVWMKPDSSFVSGTTTTINGTFRLTPIQEKDGILCISCIGYDKLYMDVKGIYKSVDLGELFLVPSCISLTGVEIKASSVIHAVDRQVFYRTIKSKNQLTDLKLPGV